MAGRNARGMGNIRKKSKVDKKTGKKYEWWEARYTAGRDPGTGKQVQRTITGKTHREVSQKLAAVVTSIDSGTYIDPNKRLSLTSRRSPTTSSPPSARYAWRPWTPPPFSSFTTSLPRPASRCRSGTRRGKLSGAAGALCTRLRPCPPRPSRTSTGCSTRPYSRP